MTLTWNSYASHDAFAGGVLDDLRGTIETAVSTNGHATVALSGGKTPVAILERIAGQALPWTSVTLLPSDDRIVPITHPLSNAGMLVRVFGRSGARVLPLVSEVTACAEAGARADALLQRVDWPLDLVWLGMGADGHTASIFPGPDLAAALTAPASQRAIGVHPDPLPPEAPVDRVTLTASAIGAARRLMLVIEGDAKRAVLERAAAEGAASQYPIGRLLAQLTTPVNVHWVGSF